MMVPLLGPSVCARSTTHFEITYLQSLDKALELFIEFEFCESDFYFLNGSKNCIVAAYNFGSVYILRYHGSAFPNCDVFLSLRIVFT